MASNARDKRVYPVALESLTEIFRGIGASNLNVVVKSENPTPEGVWFRIHHGVSFTSWGEKITVTLTPAEGGTLVDVFSECGMPTQIVDWGKNASNVRAIFGWLDKQLGAAPQGAPAPETRQAPMPEPDFVPAPAPQASAPLEEGDVCPACGTINPYGAPVCSGCGAPMPVFPDQPMQTCPACGKPQPMGARFCGDCGAQLL